LYDMLTRFDRSPVVLLNRAIAMAEVSGSEVALAEIEALAEPLRDYPLLHATRAQLLTALGRDEEARAANLRALQLTANPAEQGLLRDRIGQDAG
jgi:RNA polymerase sigma-70 factor (ECF subfamily)